MNKKKVVIVGGVAGGASAAARLRRLDEQAEIIIFEKGEYISFANCGLPYYIGGEIKEKSALTLQTPKSFNDRFNIDVRIFSEVISIDPANKAVTVRNHKDKIDYVEEYDSLILSMGAEPIRPNMEGINLDTVFTLRNIPDTYKIKNYIDNNAPKSAVVVGGGYIGIEMAENLHLAGVQVTIVELQNQLIAPLDYDMACDVHNHITEKGVDIILNEGVTAIKKNGASLTVSLTTKSIDTDMVILAIGVRPETAIAASAGISLNKRGAIIVDDYMQTSKSDIYAVGDAIEVCDLVTNERVIVPLAGPANKQGRIAADNICGLHSTYKKTQGSSILKVFDMTVATTGINEKTARRLNLDYEKSFTYSQSHASYYPGASGMSIKLIFNKSNGKILGAQIVGYDGVDKRCDVLATAIRFNATAYDLASLELCYAPPYSSAKDPVNMAAFVIENILSGRLKQFHWHEIPDLIQDSNAFVLDTRTLVEYNNGHIDGSVSYPLDSLRVSLENIPRDKKIYVICQVGLRGYFACRILQQNGFDCYNLSGGYRLYSAISNSENKSSCPHEGGSCNG